MRGLASFTQVSVVFLISTIQFNAAYQDKNLTCPNGQRISGFSKNAKGPKKDINNKCASFPSSVSDTISCSKAKALKCDGQFEGCPNSNSWFGGFEVFDMGNNVEMYVPHCCTSPKIKLENGKCTQKTKVNGNFDYNVQNNAAIYRVNCQYVKSKDGKSLQDMTMAFEECTYTTQNGEPVHKGAPAAMIKNGNNKGGADKPANDKPLTDKPPTDKILTTTGATTRVTTQAPTTVDANMCFTRLLVKNKALDYAEDSKPLNLITTLSVLNFKECADKCYNAEKNMNRRCRSFRLSGSSCSLRENYVEDKVKSLSAPIDAVYGNWTNTACSSKA